MSDATAPDALRDQIAEALYQWTTKQAAGGPARLLTRDETVLWENSLARADAVLPVVAAALTTERDDARKRAEQAEAAVQRVRDLHVRDDSSPHGPWCGTCLAPWPCRTRLAAEPDRPADPPAKETR